MIKSLPSQQRGAALLTVLLLLLIMTLLGLASLRSGLLEERMSGNLLDRGVSFQTAEAALREAEAVILTRPAYTGAGGLYPLPGADAAPRWLDPNPANWRAATNLGGTSAAVTARFIIEEMGVAPTWRGCDRVIPVDPSCLTGRFRITSISQAPGRAQVMLQSNYAMATP
jgi:type IV pilus assembly protein PilX